MAFSFSFAGDDIDETAAPVPPPQPAQQSAFPVQGKPMLPPTLHHIDELLATLPSKIAFSGLPVALEDAANSEITLPRRELWDVRLQLMAEDGNPSNDTATSASSGLGTHDVKTGVYEGGFKSWESSVDLVKVLAAQDALAPQSNPVTVIELGCGTALPSLALLQTNTTNTPKTFILADYNPTVLQHVTLPNVLLTWAVANAPPSCYNEDNELEITPEVLDAFRAYLANTNTTLYFLSGAWGPEFDTLLTSLLPEQPTNTLLLAAETIYSPFALQQFTSTLFSILNHERGHQTIALIGAKKLYFGVGGSLDDFVDTARANGGAVEYLREETEGVRRGVVKCTLSQ